MGEDIDHNEGRFKHNLHEGGESEREGRISTYFRCKYRPNHEVSTEKIR
jgi:hypothetical protein